MSARDKVIAVAGGSGFIGSAIVRRLSRGDTARVRVITRDPERARKRFADLAKLEFAAADINQPDAIGAAVAGADTIINAVQFDGYPVENPRRGLTFDRVDHGGTVALIAAAKPAGVTHFIYISGAAADEHSANAAFRAKGRAEHAIRAAGIAYTIFRPSLVYGPDDRAVNLIAKLITYMPVAIVPGGGKQKLQPLCADDLAEAVAIAAISGRGRNGTFAIGGPDLLTFDDFVRLLMEVIGVHRPIIHLPAGLLNAAGAIAERLPMPLFSRAAAGFLLADNGCDNTALLQEFGLRLTPAREGLRYLAPKT